MRRAPMLALLLFVAVLLTSELSLTLPILGVGPDLLVMVLVAYASGGRPMQAATFGFVAGLLRDLTLASPAGISAFAFAVTGYAVALAGAVRGVWASIGVVAGASFVSQVLYGFGTLLLTPNASLAALPRVALVVAAYNSLLTPLVMPLIKRFATAAGTAGTQVADRP